MRVFAYVALALLTLFTVAGVLHRLAPYPADDKIGDKLRLFAEHRDEYDLLILGSSRTQAGVIPERVEAELATRGVQIRAFNLAMNAMGPHETDATVREVLALRPARLRWALIELDYWEGNIRRKEAFSHRVFLWHDWQATYSAMRSAFLYAKKPEQKRRRMLNHFLHFGGHVTALGRGPEVVASLLTQSQDRELPDWMVEARGHREPAWCGAEGWEDFFSQPCGAAKSQNQFTFYRRKCKRLISRNRAAVELDGVDVRAAERRSATLRGAGVVPLHYIPPRLKPTPHLWRLEEQNVIEYLFAFNDPAAYPELYALKNRCDCDHLAQSGAEMLSALLGERLAEVVGSPGL